MINSLYVVFEALSIILCLHYLYGKQVKINIQTVMIVVLDVIWMNTIYYYKWDNNLSLIVYGLFFIYSGIEFGFDVKKMIVNNILYTIIFCVLQATIIIVTTILFEGILEGMLLQLFVSVVSFLVVGLGLRKCKLNNLSTILCSRERLVHDSLIILMISGFFFMINFKKTIGFTTFYFGVLVVCIFLIVIVAIDIGKYKMHVNEVETELKMHKLYEESFKNLIEDICARQHEFDNHINAMYNQHILYTEYNELVVAQRQYCDSIISENHFNKLLSKGNHVIIGFLYSKFLEAEKDGICVKYNIAIKNLENSIPEYKYIELLGNLINNAVEEIREQREKDLIIKMIESNEDVYIEVGNKSKGIDYSKIEKYFAKGYSEKGNNRGYGLYNVKKICDEYSAQLSCEYREEISMLVFSVLINKSL